MKRHTCIICGKKRNEFYMKNVFASSWACNYPKDCYCHSDIYLSRKILSDLKKLKKINIKHLMGGR